MIISHRTHSLLRCAQLPNVQECPTLCASRKIFCIQPLKVLLLQASSPAVVFVDRAKNTRFGETLSGRLIVDVLEGLLQKKM